MGDEVQPHAVRWAFKSVGLVERFSKWHWTLDASRTICGRLIPIGGEVAFLPEADDDPGTVECRVCRKIAGESQ